MYIYGSYCKIKTGVSLFWTTRGTYIIDYVAEIVPIQPLTVRQNTSLVICHFRTNPDLNSN